MNVSDELAARINARAGDKSMRRSYGKATDGRRNPPPLITPRAVQNEALAK
jgi:hypothetical protein